ncbi:efflux RND transporter permease subunit [Bdellovibrio sp. KM01]|uniref:efflux RND transporter permease subunit n=1 Tax=Bdellovibrio sp. KM01 TaxID=2748865 RepID=UPI0015E9BD67|nr:efflux RND transporter permease subunit [Bdellovibrio sp. KM01]QLY26351.1 efflux RND transporter permease subunit [Bdellovibrio sp. KM01]
MSPALLSVRQPVFILSIVILMLTLGMISLKGLPIDLFPDVTFPTVVVQTTYGGAGPQEIETEVTKVLEDELATISGVQKVSSQNMDSVSVVMVEFSLKTNLNFAEQEVRAKVQNVMRELPDDIDQPVIRKVSPSDAPIMYITLLSDMEDGKLYDLAKEVISPQFEQVPQVGQVEILGGRKREIHVSLDYNKLNAADVSATSINGALQSGGRNVPAGKIDEGNTQYSFRTIAQYQSIAEIGNTVLRLADVYHPVSISTLGKITDTLQDESTRTRLNGKKSVNFAIYRQSGANSVKVADDIRAKVTKINQQLTDQNIAASMKITQDTSKKIRDNVYDVYESILFGIILTIIVVYFFLGSMKSTLITGFALPNSLLGACIVMGIFGFSINIMSLLAMSLVVGLLVDDAIVVRENIFRKLEAGMSPKKAAVVGTQEVTLAVIATTLTILAVFGPIGNLEGIVGQFFKQFGLTICFAMIVSLFDGLFVAPALSAYVAGSHSHAEPTSKFGIWNKKALKAFDRFQSRLEEKYVKSLKWSLAHPMKTILGAVGIFIFSIFIARFVPFTFLPPQDNGEFFVMFELPPGASLDGTDEVARTLEDRLKKHKEIEDVLAQIGSSNGEAHKGNLYIRLVPSKQRKKNTTQMKEVLRDEYKDLLAKYNIIVTDNPGQQNSRQFNVNIVGQDMNALIEYSNKVLAKLKENPSLSQPDTSFRVGKPEFQIKMKPDIARMSGVTLTSIGNELRTLIEGLTPAIYRENGVSYDVRVRLQPDQRDLRKEYGNLKVPNLNNRLVPLANVAEVKASQGPSQILRENRNRYIQLSADITPGGKGIGGVMTELTALTKGELKPPAGVTFSFVGEAERFAELMQNILVSMGLGVMFIYLVLASLYGSFITPFTIMAVIPLAACGAFLSLFITRSSFDLFSMIGCVMLMGLATKNSILLIDSTMEQQKEGKTPKDALVHAGFTRLRPIIMTSLALIAGMIPVAIGLNEASKSRTSLGIVVIGGTISSTLLTLYVIPALHLYVHRFSVWFMAKYHKIFGHDATEV